MDAVAETTEHRHEAAELWTSDSQRIADQATTTPAADVAPVAESEPEQAVAEPAETKPAKAGNPRHDLNARLGQEVEKTKAEKSRADRLEAELAALRSTPRAETPKAAAPSAENKFLAFDAWSEKHPDGTYDDYIDARAEAKAQAVLTAREAAAEARKAEQDYQQAQAAYVQRNEAAKAANPEWGTVAAGLAQRFYAAGYQDFPPALDRAIVTSDRSADLIYYLGTHPDVALQLAQEAAATGPDAAPLLRRYLESQLSPLAAAPDSAPKVRPSAAHAPINRVGGTANATPADPDDLDFGPEYIRRENAREKKAREAGRW